MQNVRLDEAQGGIKIARKNIHNLRYADDTTLMALSKEELKSLLMKVKEESENVGLCIQPGLAICFTLDSILLSMLFSQHIPPSPSPTESWGSSYSNMAVSYC